MTTFGRSNMPPWRRALTATANLVVGAGALAAAALTWNPLPLILFGLGQPVWLYRAASSARFTTAAIVEARAEREAAGRRAQLGLARHLAAILTTTPCAAWIADGRLPDYVERYRQLVALRDDAARLVRSRRDAVSPLEDDLVDGLDALLCGYLTMARERLLLHCALAQIYPRLPALDDVEAADGAPLALLATAQATLPRSPARPLVTIADAIAATAARARAIAAASAAGASHDDVYRTLAATLEERLAELAERGRRDQAMAAQLEVFPDQFALVHGKLSAARADLGAVVTDMQLLVEQTEDTVRFAADARDGARAPA